MTMLAADAGPFAALGSKQDRYGDRGEWIPFVAVDDVDAATKRAVSLGASLVREKSRGRPGSSLWSQNPLRCAGRFVTMQLASVEARRERRSPSRVDEHPTRSQRGAAGLPS